MYNGYIQEKASDLENSLAGTEGDDERGKNYHLLKIGTRNSFVPDPTYPAGSTNQNFIRAIKSNTGNWCVALNAGECNEAADDQQRLLNIQVKFSRYL